MNILLDTTVLIDLLRARRERRALLNTLLGSGHVVSISAINVAEVYAGMRPHEQVETDRFLSAFPVLPVSNTIARRAGNLRAAALRQGTTLSLTDMLIAATALEHNLVLATDNRKDFPVSGVSFLPLP